MEENISPAVSEKSSLTQSEQQEFKRLDQIARDGFEGMVDAGLALEQIRAKRLYRAEYKTFREYCDTFLDLTPQYVGRLISAGKVLGEMETFVSKNGLELELPKAEAVLRELKPVKAVSDRVAVYQKALAAAGKPPTAIEVAVEVKRHIGDVPTPTKEKKTPRTSAEDSDRLRTARGIFDDFDAGLLPKEILVDCLRGAIQEELEE